MEEIPEAQRERLRANLVQVTRRIEDASARAGRPCESVRLVAVTKSVGPPLVRALAALGVADLGENRPEEIPVKSAAVAGTSLKVRWHLIGHYQSRKIRSTLSFLHLVHSVHSTRLLDNLQEGGARLGRRLSVLLQVNLSGEETRQGFRPDALHPVLDSWERWPSLDVLGLMTMAPLGLASPGLRALFAGLRELRDRCSGPGRSLPELSMGMSQDFEEAILEGATLVRIGTALFQGILPEAP